MSRTVLIPSAGFGTRVGNPNAKEMFLRPESSQMPGQPMISYALSLAISSSAKAHVILRAEKIGLLKYLRDLEQKEKSFKTQVSTQLVSKTREWPETLLLAQPYWSEFNVVCLPDTDFMPKKIVDEMFEKLESGSDVVFATFTANDYKSWGVISVDEGTPASQVDSSTKFERNYRYIHCEKPEKWDQTTRAWGLFGFRKKAGTKILSQMLESTFDHIWRPVQGEISLIPMTYFEDLTRG
jgi:dTDP-glucose pyrophosphorylase